MKTLLSLSDLWVVLLVVARTSCVPPLENEDATMGNTLHDGIADEEVFADADLISDPTPEISLHLQPPNKEFRVTVKEVPIEESIESVRKNTQPKKPTKLRPNNARLTTVLKPPTREFQANPETVTIARPSRVLEPPTREFQTNPSDRVPMGGARDARPQAKHEELSDGTTDVLRFIAETLTSNAKSIFRSRSSGVRLPGMNPKPLVPAPVIKVPVKAVQPKKNERLNSQKKVPAKTAGTKKLQEPSQFLEPPTREFGEMSKKVVRTEPVFLPARRVQPPTREFTGRLTPVVLFRAPPVGKFAVPPSRELRPPR